VVKVVGCLPPSLTDSKRLLSCRSVKSTYAICGRISYGAYPTRQQASHRRTIDTHGTRVVVDEKLGTVSKLCCRSWWIETYFLASFLVGGWMVGFIEAMMRKTMIMVGILISLGCS
jgi:hypothetical protein